MDKQDQMLLAVKPVSIRSLYENYADMLLGYIFEIVKDRKLAEEYLVKIFTNISSSNFNKLDWEGTNTWCQLMRFAKNELLAFNNTVADCETDDVPAAVMYKSSNKYLDRMTDEQKHVFCSFYYHKKTTAELSKELNRSEDLIRISLKEAFTIIRSSHGN
jgi:DNA-directed RNA polymerase specialized sigma24 family protein